MLTLAAYLGYVRRPFSLARYLTVIGLFALGLMAKPMLVTLPLVLLLLDYWPLGRMTPGECWGGEPRWGGSCTATPGAKVQLSLIGRLLLEKLPLLLLAAASCAVTLWAQTNAIAATEQVPLAVRLGNAAVSYVAYLVQFFYPVDLAVLYPFPTSGLPIEKVAAATFVLAAISGGGVIWRRRCPYLLVGWLWYLGMLIPVIGLVQVGYQAMADRYTYLPEIGVTIALAWGASDLARSWPHRGWVGGVASAVALAALMGCAWQQTGYWRDSETLWNHTLASTRRNHIAHYNLGVALDHLGRIDEAMSQYRKALEVKPDYVDARMNLGVDLASRGQTDEAIAAYRETIRLAPQFATAHNNLGVALAGVGQIDEAILQYQKTLELDPGFAEAYNNLGNALAVLGQLDEAIADYDQALKRLPDYAEAHNNRGSALLRQGRTADAAAEFGRAVTIKPNYAEAHHNLGVALEAVGRTDEAMSQFQEALNIRPNYAEAHNALGAILGRQGRLAEAIVHFRKVLEANPNHEGARRNLDFALRQQGTAP